MIVAVGCWIGPPIARLIYDMGEAAIIAPFLLLMLVGLLASPILLLSIIVASIGRAIADFDRQTRRNTGHCLDQADWALDFSPDHKSVALGDKRRQAGVHE
jgi:hypothetical protein